MKIYAHETTEKPHCSHRLYKKRVIHRNIGTSVGKLVLGVSKTYLKAGLNIAIVHTINGKHTAWVPDNIEIHHKLYDW